MSGDSAEGGCLCGAIRYRVTGDPVAATLCHCGSCRRASGGTNVAWAVFDKSQFEWLSAGPKAYSSSPGIDWLSCPICGSLVGYRRASRPDHMDITTSTLDDPDRYPPTVEIWLEQKIGWETLHPDLPNRQQSSLNDAQA
ncbi:MAG: GFA family protein [Sphingomonas sp.]|uniref:GFA family protein n=1 Tax=Sphingomonas sp. TaxID=28214 RepID=UPI00178EC910|nr:GFA family protein [Sphingomonas sp.]MBA3667585.1 GFA family protein [Sphingomonas sp.]